MKVQFFLLKLLFIVIAQEPQPSPRCDEDIFNIHQYFKGECMEHDGMQRCWWLPHVPGLNSTTKVPLVVEMHGYSGCAEYNSYTRFVDVAAENDFILVWPQGTYDLPGTLDNTSSWNVSDKGPGLRCFGGASEAGIDDVGFITKLIEKLSNEYPIDTSRVYMAGHSNGCAMAQMMAAKKSSIVAAVACHAMYLLASPSSDYQPTSIMEIHGEADLVVSYDNWNWCMNTSAQSNIEKWKTLNNCKNKATESFGKYHTTTYTQCDDDTEVVLVSLPNVGHTPYNVDKDLAELYNMTNLSPINTASIAWDFLKRFKKDSQPPIDPSPESNTSPESSTSPTDDSSAKTNGNTIFPGLIIISLLINQLMSK